MEHFDAKRVARECVTWIRDYFTANGDNNTPAIVGISGGKDSTVVAALCAAALGRERVIGVLMPDGIQHDLNEAIAVAGHLQIKSFTTNIGNITEAVYGAIKCSDERLTLTKQVFSNVPARIRMTILYSYALMFSGRVANTCNLSEDFVGWATLHGDMAGEFCPLANLTTDEVIAVGVELSLPENTLYKTPEDGLCGKSDEEAFGFTYRQLNDLVRVGTSGDKAVDTIIAQMHENSRWKYRKPAEFKPLREQ